MIGKGRREKEKREINKEVIEKELMERIGERERKYGVKYKIGPMLKGIVIDYIYDKVVEEGRDFDEVVDYAIDVFIALPTSDMEAVAAEVDELVKSQ